MDEGEKEVQRYISLVTCLGVVLIAEQAGGAYNIWSTVLSVLALFAGLRYARAVAGGRVPPTGMLALLVAAILVLSGTIIIGNVVAFGSAMERAARDVLSQQGDLGNFLVWLVRRTGSLVLMAGVAFALLRLSSRKSAGQGL